MRPGLWPAEVTRGDKMVRAERASRLRVVTGSSLTFASCRTDAAVSRSQFGVQNGALRRRAGAELSRRGEDELARGKRIRRQGTLTARLSALRTPLPENSNDFGLLCGLCTGLCIKWQLRQICGSGSLDQHRASSQPVEARQAGSARLRVQLAGHDLLRCECRCGMTLMSVSKMRR